MPIWYIYLIVWPFKLKNKVISVWLAAIKFKSLLLRPNEYLLLRKNLNKLPLSSLINTLIFSSLFSYEHHFLTSYLIYRLPKEQNINNCHRIDRNISIPQHLLHKLDHKIRAKKSKFGNLLLGGRQLVNPLACN